MPIYKGAEGLKKISDKVQGLIEKLRAKGISVKYDDRDTQKPGWKFADYELKGVPVRLAMGERDLENGTIEVARRDTLTKETLPLEGIVGHIEKLLEDIQENIYKKALDFRNSMITKVDSYDEFKNLLESKGGFFLCHWDGTAETEEKIKADTKATIRCIPFDCPEVEGKDMVTGFIRLNGMTIGAVANRAKIYDEEGNAVQEFGGTLSVRGCKKAADFVNFCDAFNIPVVTLTNVTGFEASKCSEKSLAREAAKLTYAFANATVPKVNLIIGKAYGCAYVTMNSKSIGADMVYAWPTAEIGMMDSTLAAKIMYADSDAETINAKASEYREIQSSPISAERRGYVDTIIEPADTRKYLIGAFEMLFTKREDRPAKKHGTV